MKRLISVFAMAVLTVALVACGDQNNNDNETDNGMNDMNDMTNETENNVNNGNNNQADNDTDEDDMQQKMSQLSYTDFELEVDYGPDKEYEAEIEQNKEEGTIEADLEDEINGDDLNGQAAFDKIFPLVEQLTIEQDTTKEDAISEVLDVFDLDDNYEKFEVEITFTDGTKLEFED